MKSEAMQIAERLGGALQSRDVGEFERLYHDDIKIFLGATGTTQDKAENIAFVRAIFAVTSKLSYRNLVRHEIEGGILQQHTLNGEFIDGTPMPEVYACVILKMAEGKIVSIAEYFDSAQFSELTKRLAAA